MRSMFVVVAICLAPVLASGQGLSKDQYTKAMSKALDDIGQLSQRQQASGSRVRVAANLFFAHEAFIERMPQDVLLKAIDAFADAGIYRVDINVGLYPWVDGTREQIAKYDAAVDRIRARRMQLALNPQYSPIKQKVGSLREWREKALPVYADLAARYKPDTFVVVHEPTTMAARMRVKTSPQEWRDFARDAARIVKEKSPNSRIGAGGLFEEKEYYNAFVEMPEVDVMTLDVYRLVGLKDYNEMARRAKDRGKAVYIEETWRPPYYEARRANASTLDAIAAKSVGDRTFESLDIKWMQTIHRYAGALGLEAITPVWMQAFFKYVDGEGDALDPGYNRQVAEAIMRGERTKTYDALRSLAGGSR